MSAAIWRRAAGAGLGMLALGLLAVLTGLPLLFPAIGASAALMALSPDSKGASARSCWLGHALGALIGWACLQLLAGGAGHSLAQAQAWPWVLSGSLALLLTVAALLWASIPHPPAAATTMIVGMGLLPELWQVLALIAAATATAGVAWVLQARQRSPAG